jgi:hypothetical protein
MPHRLFPFGVRRRAGQVLRLAIAGLTVTATCVLGLQASGHPALSATAFGGTTSTATNASTSTSSVFSDSRAVVNGPRKASGTDTTTTATTTIGRVTSSTHPVSRVLPTPHHRVTAIYTKRVWASGYQRQIDACRGAVDLTRQYRVPTIGERWDCGGSTFPRMGHLVRLTGIRSGIYKVGPVVAILNAHTARSVSIPRGYDLLYQTCLKGDARTVTFVALLPVR